MANDQAESSIFFYIRPNMTNRIYYLILFSLIISFFAFWCNSRNGVFVYLFIDDEGPFNVSKTCSRISDLNKIDCHPEVGVSKNRCQQRECCYETYDKNCFPSLNVPFCFYPLDYVGYTIDDIHQDGRQITAQLKRGTPSGFPKDITELKLVITFISDFTVRIKVLDAKSKRFEVPISINASLRDLKQPLYNVKLDSKTGELSVTRKSSNIIIFQTNLFQLVYADQFLQLSSSLPSPYIYGIGEKYGSFLRSVNWTKITLFNSDQPPVINRPLYGSHPFYLSLEDYGNANGVFLLNSNAMDVILQPTPAITFRPIGGIFDFFIMLGPSPANVVQQYTSIVGRTFMPPIWSLGFHLCRFGYKTLNKTRETMQRNIDAGIPVAVQWNDIDYMDQFKDFTYDHVNFDGLPEFVEDLHQKELHYVIMTDPGISSSEAKGSYPPYDKGIEDDVFIKNPNGSYFEGKVWTDGELVFPDFSHPNATSWWTKQFQDFYEKVKFDGVWIDMNEPSNFYNGGKDGCMSSSYEDPVYVPGDLPMATKTVCMTAKHYNTIHYNEHNLYGYREAAATYEALKSIRGKRPFIISRASFPGQGVHSGHWSGDISSTWEDMRYTIPSMLNFNLYGISMVGSDICGFNGNTTVSLCTRWQALGAFYPFSRNHNERITIEQDPVALGNKVVDAAKTSLHIRDSMMPYLYTLFYRSHVYGDTVVRPLFFEYPWDENTYSVDEQFLWGGGVLIVPVLYPKSNTVNIYLPKGIWLFDSPSIKINPIVSLGERFDIPIQKTQPGLFFRGGFVLPAWRLTAEGNRAYVLMAILDENKKATGELYWDDGKTIGTYEAELYNLIQFSATENSFTSVAVHAGYATDMDASAVTICGIDRDVRQLSVNNVTCIHTQRLSPFPSSFPPSESKTDFKCSYSLEAAKHLVIKTDGGFSLLQPSTILWGF